MQRHTTISAMSCAAGDTPRRRRFTDLVTSGDAGLGSIRPAA